MGIMVHRLLQAALEKESMNHWNSKGVAKILDNCNLRKLAAKTLQESHSELHLSALIRKSGSIEVKGIVLAVLDHAVDVVILFMGIVRRLYLERRKRECLATAMHHPFQHTRDFTRASRKRRT